MNRFSLWILPAVIFAFASTAEARPPDSGDWDAREIPVAPLVRQLRLAPGKFNWNSASYSERRDFLVLKGFHEGLATQAALGGAPLTPVRYDGRGLFLGNMADGVWSRGFGLILRFW